MQCVLPVMDYEVAHQGDQQGCGYTWALFQLGVET
jgi:hypothetical protein